MPSGNPYVDAGVQGAQMATSLYTNKKQLQAQKEARQQQEEANKAQLAYMQQHDYDSAVAAANAQRNNYGQWRAAQETSNDLLQAREARMGQLAPLIGAAPRVAIRTNIPDYIEPTLPKAPSGSYRLADYLNY